MVGKNHSYDSQFCDILRFFGVFSVRPETIKIKYLNNEFQFTDIKIARFSKRIADELRQAGKLYDGPLTMKLSSFKKVGDDLVMTVQPAAYDKVAGSCFALDVECKEEFGNSLTLRNYYKNRNLSGDIEGNQLAISLGVCGLLVTEKAPERFLRVRRAKNLASFSGTFGPSVAGSVDFDTKDETLNDLIVNHLSREVTEELMLSKDEFEIRPLAYGREIYRGERPQLFALIRSKLSESELKDRIAKLSDEKREFDQFEFLDMNQSDLNLNVEAMMNLQMVLEFYSLKKPS